MASRFQIIIENAAKRGEKLLEAICKVNEKKKLASGAIGLTPNFTISEAAKTLGCHANTIRKLETDGRLDFDIRRQKSGNTPIRVLNLNEINKIRDVLGKRPKKPKGSKCKRVVVSHLKGGVGKSTHAVHFAHFLAAAGYQVLLLDSDPQGTTTSAHGILGDVDLGDGDDIGDALLKDPALIKKSIRKTKWDNLDLIPARLELEFVDWKMTMGLSQSEPVLGPMPLRMHRALQTIEDEYDVIVIDTPPSLGVLSLNTIASASIVVMPTTPTMFDVSSTAKYFEIMQSLLRNYSKVINPEAILILLTKLNENPTPTMNRMLQQFSVCYGELMMQSRMGVTDEFNKAASNSCSMYETKASTEAYKRARTMIDNINAEILANVQELWDQEAGIESKSKTPPSGLDQMLMEGK